MLRDTRQQLVIAYQIMNKNVRPPFVRQVLLDPALETYCRFAAEVDLDFTMQVWQCSQEVLESSCSTKRLREPVHRGQGQILSISVLTIDRLAIRERKRVVDNRR